MTDEERKAIEYVKDIKNWWRKNSPDRIYAINKTDIEELDILLNLINKQEKAIDRMVQELSNYAVVSDTSSKWCKFLKCNKWSNGYCIENDLSCIKDYFIKEDK